MSNSGGTYRTLLIAGVFGSGKGTQAKRLAEKVGGIHLSSGDIIRDHAPGADRAIMDAGRLIPEDSFERMIRPAIEAIPLDTHLILDGMAKKGTAEAQILLEILFHVGRRLGQIVEIGISLETALARSAKRLTEVGNTRADDDPKNQITRYNLFEEDTRPSIAYLRRYAPYTFISGEGNEDEVEALVWDAVRGLFPADV